MSNLDFDPSPAVDLLEELGTVIQDRLQEQQHAWRFITRNSGPGSIFAAAGSRYFGRSSSAATDAPNA